jgi:hypothetical protein
MTLIGLPDFRERFDRRSGFEDRSADGLVCAGERCNRTTVRLRDGGRATTRARSVMTLKHFPNTHDLLPDALQRAKPDTAGVHTLLPGLPSRLDAFGSRLLANLGHGLVLTETARLYPHVVNKLAVVWNDAKSLDDYLDALLYADRNGRAGLDFKAAAELADVRNVRVRLLRNARPVS